MFDTSNCLRGMYDNIDNVNGNEGCIGILKPESLNEKYRTPEYQLFRMQCGFGVYPDKMGNAVYGEFCADGEHTRMEKYQFIGIADEETTKYAEELEKKWKEETK